MDVQASGGQERLLRALAEQLKNPIMHIARAAELARLTDEPVDSRVIEYTADMTLQLIDSYLLSVQLQAQPSLDLEPMSVQAGLCDVAQRLDGLAKQYDCQLHVHNTARQGLAMGHSAGFAAAFMSLGYAFIVSKPPQAATHRVVLGVHRSGTGLVAGVYGTQPFGGDSLRRARLLYGRALSVFPKNLAGNGASVFVADALLKVMSTPLRSARHASLPGLAATLTPSKQLQLV
ncbi:hypothetical protein CR970_03680 [Candidatus Saccharibacteria bacterium]|nr:MAG: hypothetical protein CR970_03680 [Candidatus Saccharibacteria bacterium]